MSFARSSFVFKQKTAYEIGLGIPAEPLFRSVPNPKKSFTSFSHSTRNKTRDGLIRVRNIRALNGRFNTSRSEERRVGKEWRNGRSASYYGTKKTKGTQQQ